MIRVTNRQKRRAVILALHDPELAQLSCRKLAQEVGVSHSLVHLVRHDLSKKNGRSEKDVKRLRKGAA